MIYQKAEQGGARYHLGLAGVRTLPDEWEVVELGSLLQAERGISVGVMYPGKHDPNGIALIKAGDINNNVLNRTPEFRITSDKHREYQRTELVGGELLITLVGALGQCVIVPFDMEVCNAARAIAVVRLKELEDVGFVRACLLSRPLQHIMQVWANTTVQPTINLKEIKKLPLPWPPEDERKAITEVLGAFDDKIELNRQMNATLEEMARAIFKSWFVDFDPVHVKARGEQPYGMDAETAALFPDRFEVVDGRDIPVGWRIGTLGNLVGFQNGFAFKSKDWQDEGIPVVKIGSVKPGIVDLSNVSYVLPELADETDARYKLSIGDLLIGMTGYVGEVGLVPSSSNGPLLNQRVGKFVLQGGFDETPYVYCLTRDISFKANVEQRARGTAQANVSGKAILGIPTIIPEEGVQSSFNKMCLPMLKTILANHEESRILAELRDTLLPRLMSGQLRIGYDVQDRV